MSKIKEINEYAEEVEEEIIIYDELFSVKIKGGESLISPITVDYVINKIEEMQSVLNLENLQVWSNFPGVKHQDCMNSIKLFTEKVIPHFKSKAKSKIKAAS